jgi:2'-5' RNA ligase
MGFAVFIEPEGELRSNILRWKEMVEDKYPNQSYCLHPPHSTLIHVNVKQEEMGIAAVGKILKDITAFKNRIRETDVFWNDSATGGGHTLFWKIKSNQILFDLQRQVAESLNPFLSFNPEPTFVKNSSLLKNSFDRYGFPFIGNHWIPHLTIASLKTGQNDLLIEDFLEQSCEFELDVKEVSCWRVENDQHYCLEKYKLV